MAELHRVLDLDARMVCIKGGPAHTPSGLTSPADRRFDPFWGLVNESGVAVGIHSGDAGYGRYINDWEPYGGLEAFRHSPLRSVISSDRPPFETMAALVCQGLFDRFPTVRVASIEAGAEWVPALVKKLAKAYGQMPSAFASDPVETFRQHVWVAPFYEDDLAGLKEVLGSTACCSAPTGRTPRAWPSPPPSPGISVATASTRTRSAPSWSTTAAPLTRRAAGTPWGRRPPSWPGRGPRPSVGPRCYRRTVSSVSPLR